METEVKKMGAETTRGVILLPLDSDLVSRTKLSSGTDIYIVYDNDMIVVCKDIDTMNLIKEKKMALIIGKEKKKKGM